MTGVQIWVELVDGIVMARMRGIPGEAINREYHKQILQLIGSGENGRVLYDIREVENPTIEAPMAQWKIENEFGPVFWKRAVVVPNERVAYLTGIGLEGQKYRIFYNDFDAAIRWLKEESGGADENK